VAGRKVFTSGEILTAADVNSFLMDQSVMVFADSSARSSAIPTPSEGMVTFREDQDVVEVYDGSAFKTVGGLVAVKDVLKTDTFSASLSAGANIAVPDLSITHEVSDPANKLIISAFFGQTAESVGVGSVGIAVNDGSGLINIGDAAGSLTRTTAGNRSSAGNNDATGNSLSFSYVHTPGSGSKTYTVHALNPYTTTQTVYVNRSDGDLSAPNTLRAVSSLVIQEVAV